MSREEVYTFIQTVNEIKGTMEKGVPLSEYLPNEIANAISALVASAVTREREECALVAESAAEASGTIGGGWRLEADPIQRKTALGIAAMLRDRNRR